MGDPAKKVGRYRHTDAEAAQPGARLLCRLGQIDDAFSTHKGGLHNSRVALLRFIHASGRRGVSQTAASETLQLSPGALSKICDDLEKAGLIERTAHPVDRRVRQLSLTAEGQDHLNICNRMLETTAREAFSALNDAEIDLLLKLLDKVKFGEAPDRCASCRIGGC